MMSRRPLTRLCKAWKAYRHRLVPWLAWSMPSRTVGVSQANDALSLVSDADMEQQLYRVLEVLHSVDVETTKTNSMPETMLAMRLHAVHHRIGFNVEKRPSTLEDGGTGVFVSAGVLRKGTVAAFYPGTVYEPYEPLFIASLKNRYIFRCADGYLIDGKDRGLSKAIHSSCSKREQRGPYMTNDMTWITHYPRNPLAIGQFVNNCDASHVANVAYQEYSVPALLPMQLRQYIPNVFYSSASEAGIHRLTKMVVLVSLRDIYEGEELFSTYITFVL